MTPLKYTRQGLSDSLQAWVAQSETGEIHVYPEKPAERWENGEMLRIPVSAFHIMNDQSILVVTDWPDDWRASLTSPRTDTRIDPPKAPYEVTLQVGAETFELLCSRVYDEALRWEFQGFVRKGMWGGAGTHGHVEVEQREVTPEQYRRELQDWHTIYKEARRDKAEPEVCEMTMTNLPYQLSPEVTATEKGLLIEDSKLAQFLGASYHWLYWKDAAERLRYRKGELWCAVPSTANVLLIGSGEPLGKDDRPLSVLGWLLLHRTASIVCEGVHSFRVLYECTHRYDLVVGD